MPVSHERTRIHGAVEEVSEGWRWSSPRTWCFAVILLLMLLATGLVLSSCSDDGELSNADQVTTFSFDEHDLCEWVSAEEIAGFVSSQFDWDGDVVESEPPVDVAAYEERGEVACSWRLNGDDDGHVTVFAPTALDVGDETHDFADVDVGVPLLVGGPVRGHPSLSTGVVYFTEPYHNTAFGVLASDNYLIASFELPDLEHRQISQADSWDRWFAVADQIIGELGWR